MSLAEMRDLNVPLEEVIESFFRANYDLSTKTERWYRQNLRDFVAFVERARGREARLSDLDKTMADAFLKARSKTPTATYPSGSPFATRAASVTIKRFANYLAQDNILTDALGLSVLKHVKRGKVDDDVRRPLSDDQVARVIAAATSIGGTARAALILGLGSGLRLNEMREARVDDLDLARGEFNVRPETSKFGKGRTISLHPDVAHDLERYLRERGAGRDPDAPLLPTRASERFTIDGFGKLFARIRSRSGLRDFSAHLLRHTWATNFMRQPGASLLELKRQGGWQRWEQVERYSHAVPVQDRRAMPNPLALQKTALGQLPSTRVSRLSSVG